VARYRYEERMWVPWWVYALAIAICGGFFALIGVLGGTSGWFLLAVSLGYGLFMALVFAWSTALRRIRIDDRFLELGFGDRVDLRWIQEVQPVSGGLVRRIRARILDPGAGTGAAAGGMLAGTLGHALGRISLGLSSLRGLQSRRGAVCPAWMKTAVYITTLPGQGTVEWLVGTRRPDELAEALRRAADDASSQYLALSDAERLEQAAQEHSKRGP
jgi:Protein of unknown function (DUF3093)